MADFILLMHDDAPDQREGWEAYIEALNAAGVFRGGSSVGAGASLRKTGAPAPLSPVNGYIRIEAENLAQAQSYLAGNPAYEAGGTVEVRELPRD